MNFDHVTDPELRALLSGEKEVADKENLDFVVRLTLKAWEVDHNPFNIAYLDMNSASYEERRNAIDSIYENWGNHEDGDAKAFSACQRFWTV